MTVRGWDVIGDVHGCADELVDLLHLLGYPADTAARRHPGERQVVFIGDLVDRGPDNVTALRIAMAMVADGGACCVAGNHDVQLQRLLEDQDVPLVYGLDGTIEQLGREPETFRREALSFLQSLPGHYQLDEGRLVVAHTGLPEELHGVEAAVTRHMAAYGLAPSESDPHDVSARHRWVHSYRGAATVVHGHTPVSTAVWRNHTIDIDTGCAFGGRLTALRWPERELMAVSARRVYATAPSYF